MTQRSIETKLLAEPIVGVTDAGIFEGYASLFGVADLGKDMVVPGAFAASPARRGIRGVRMLWQHDPAQPIGRWLSIAEDARGLRVRGKLNLAVERAREIHALMKDGAVDGLSVGFRAERARHDCVAGVRRLERMDLWEISVVTFPMLPGARVSGVKRDAAAKPLSPRCGERSSLRSRPGEGAYPEEALSSKPPHPRSADAALASRPPTRGPLPARGEGRLAFAIRRAARRLFVSPPTSSPPKRMS
jgi:uncharacterized protein